MKPGPTDQSKNRFSSFLEILHSPLIVVTSFPPEARRLQLEVRRLQLRVLSTAEVRLLQLRVLSTAEVRRLQLRVLSTAEVRRLQLPSGYS